MTISIRFQIIKCLILIWTIDRDIEIRLNKIVLPPTYFVVHPMAESRPWGERYVHHLARMYYVLYKHQSSWIGPSSVVFCWTYRGRVQTLGTAKRTSVPDLDFYIRIIVTSVVFRCTACGRVQPLGTATRTSVSNVGGIPAILTLQGEITACEGWRECLHITLYWYYARYDILYS